MITLHTLEPDQTIRVHLPVGARTPANCTVSGLAVLANMDEQELLAMLPDELEGTAPASIVDRARLMEELRTIRERGYAAFLGHGGRIQGRAAPIFDATGRVVASLGISAPSSRLSDGRLHELGQRAQEAALQISRQLGYVGRLSAVEVAGPAGLAQAAAPARRNS